MQYGAGMDESIVRMKDLLENSYRIIRIEMNYGVVATGNILEYKVTLKKGSGKEVIRSSSCDFVSYMMHFKKIKNRFDNDEFIYIDDLNNYETQTKGLLKDQVYIENKHAIRIMGREFKEGITTLLFKPGSPNNKTGVSMFRIDLKINPEFLHCDLKDEITVYEKSSDRLVFRGFTKHCDVQNDNTALIIVQDLTFKLQNTMLSTEFINMNPVECASTLAASMGFRFHTNFNVNSNVRSFIVVIPVKNLIINEGFKIGNVEFYQEFNTLDDLLIRKSENGRTNPEWNGNYPRAKIIIGANSFFAAIQEGNEKISTAIDIISLRTDISFPRIKIKGKYEQFVFDYYKYFSQVKIPSWVYCREMGTNSCMLIDTNFRTEKVLALEYKTQDYFLRLNQLFDELLCKNEYTQREKNILQVLHWLRRALQTGENKDKLLDLWTAMDFVVSGTKTEKVFCSEEIKNIKKIIEIGQILQEKQKEILFKKLDMINSAPLMERIKIMELEFGIIITEEERGILESTRRKRNELIHGEKAVDITEGELNKLLQL
jgi:hypothetical protein